MSNSQLQIARVKVDPTVDAAKERRHVQEATRGVVELFNAVRHRQQFINSKAEVLARGSKAERCQALEDIRKGPQLIRPVTKRLKLEVEEKENETDGDVVEVKKEEDPSSSEADDSNDDSVNSEDSGDGIEEENEDDE